MVGHVNAGRDATAVLCLPVGGRESFFRALVAHLRKVVLKKQVKSTLSASGWASFFARAPSPQIGDILVSN